LQLRNALIQRGLYACVRTYLLVPLDLLLMHWLSSWSFHTRP